MEKKFESKWSYFKNKTILITGANGYIGSKVALVLSHIHCNLILLVRKDKFLKDFFHQEAKIRVVMVDIRKKNIWKRLLGNVNIIFHFAAQTSSQFANKFPSNDAEVNLVPVVNLIESCQRYNFSPDIIFSGTATQVGYTSGGFINETFKDLPITVYDINKLAAEKYLQYYSNQLGKRAVTLRLANVYGPGPTSSRQDRGVLNLMILKALRGESLTIFRDGNFARDYIYIYDVVDAFLESAAKLGKITGNYYIIGTGIKHTIKQMVEMIRDEAMKRTGKKVEIIHVQPPKDFSKIEFRNFIADTREFYKATGWRAEVLLREGIKLTVDHFIEKKIV